MWGDGLGLADEFSTPFFLPCVFFFYSTKNDLITASLFDHSVCAPRAPPLSLICFEVPFSGSPEASRLPLSALRLLSLERFWTTFHAPSAAPFRSLLLVTLTFFLFPLYEVWVVTSSYLFP